MRLIGNEIAAAIRAFGRRPPSELHPLAAELLRHQSFDEAKGFRGRPAADAKSELRTRITSAHPELPEPEAERVVAETMDAIEIEKLRVHLYMKAAVSLVVLTLAIVMLAVKPDESPITKWATGAIGTVIGYWLS